MRSSDTGLSFAGFYAFLKLTGDANGLLSHEWNMSNRSVEFPCANCASVYNKRSSLITHLKYECGQPPRFKCPYCDLVSKKTSNVQQHIRRKHKNCMIYVLDIRHSSSDFQYNGRVLRQSLQ